MSGDSSSSSTMPESADQVREFTSWGVGAGLTFSSCVFGPGSFVYFWGILLGDVGRAVQYRMSRVMGHGQLPPRLYPRRRRQAAYRQHSVHHGHLSCISI